MTEKDPKAAGSSKPVAVPKKGGRKPSKTFRISAKSVVLTYARCYLDLHYVLRCLREKLSKFKVIDYLVVQEDHKDGTPHVHAIISCKKKIDIKSSDFLDLTAVPSSENENEVTIYHGNYEGCKSEESTLNYLCKDLNVENASERMIMSEGFSKKIDEDYSYLSLDQRLLILGKNGKIGEAMEILEAEDPKRYLDQGSKLEKRLQELHMQSLGCESEYPWESFILTPELQEAIDLFEQSIRVRSAKAFILKGEPGSGKTKFMKSLLWKKLYVLHINNIEGLAAFNPKIHQAILLDDPNLKGEDRDRLIAFLDNEKQIIKIRYRNAEIPANVVKGIATNFTLMRCVTTIIQLKVKHSLAVRFSFL